MVKKQGFPEENELVLCTVTSVQHHSAFCSLDEYEGLSGMIHVSEVASGRIRSIKDYIKEGRKIVCKVLSVNKEKGYIDLSLRRVTELQAREKLNEIKQEQLAMKIASQAAKSLKMKEQAILEQLNEKALKKYPSLYAFFESVAKGEESLSKLFPSEVSKALEEAITSRIKKQVARIKGTLSLSTFAGDGIRRIKEALSFFKDRISVNYKGSGKYLVLIEADDFKTAEKNLKEAISACERYSKQNNLNFGFEREE